ncbi:MAG: imidazole glycerol phosphate synthase subunit HisH [Lachnospiraceae bacterium]|jgi:glutamine amidotransferase|nr:imidazole glycerol phosphate synthase subunit HisH [Lachnospiraceae bacterium]
MNSKIKIIDYKAGNAPSVYHAVTHLGYKADTDFAKTADDLRNVTHIILPGVGSAKATMESLDEMGMIAALGERVLEKKTLFLGICVGLQILFTHSEEDDTDCLGWLKGQVRKFDSNKVRVPQMGWNEVRFQHDAGIGAKNGHFYFVNSYRAFPDEAADIWGVTDYNGEFASAINRENIYATQFHIEKSGEAGLGLLRGFLGL